MQSTANHITTTTGQTSLATTQTHLRSCCYLLLSNKQITAWTKMQKIYWHSFESVFCSIKISMTEWSRWRRNKNHINGARALAREFDHHNNNNNTSDFFRQFVFIFVLVNFPKSKIDSIDGQYTNTMKLLVHAKWCIVFGCDRLEKNVSPLSRSSPIPQIYTLDETILKLILGSRIQMRLPRRASFFFSMLNAKILGASEKWMEQKSHCAARGQKSRHLTFKMSAEFLKAFYDEIALCYSNPMR